jgi:hypothetical protein
MRKIILPVTALLLLTTGPVSAEGVSEQESLDCAIWSSFMVGRIEDANSKMGLASVMGWFIGQYEGMTQHTIDDAMVARSAEMTAQEMDTIGKTCLPLMKDYGARLVATGKRLTELGQEAEK